MANPKPFSFDTISNLKQVPRLILGNAYRTSFCLNGQSFSQVDLFLKENNMSTQIEERSEVLPNQLEAKIIEELIIKFTEFEKKQNPLNKWSVQAITNIAYAAINKLKTIDEKSVFADNLTTITGNVLHRRILDNSESSDKNCFNRPNPVVRLESFISDTESDPEFDDTTIDIYDSDEEPNSEDESYMDYLKLF